MDSALGTGLMGRNPNTQAMIPIRGKSLNAQRATQDRVLKNEEFLSLTNAIGAGFGSNFDYRKSNYGKVIIMTDADIDGE